jgi:hypothetical protein
MMATAAAEEIIRAAFRDFAAGEDALTVVQRRATEIDALTLRIVSANETSWRRTCRLEREARAKVETALNIFLQEASNAIDGT